MTRNPMSEGGEPRLHVARAKYLTAYVLLSDATAQLEKLAVTRGAYKRTRRSVVRAVAMIMLVGGLLGAATPRTSHATPVFAPPVSTPFGTSYWGGTYQNAPAFVDIDGDGDLDMFHGGFLASTGKYVTDAFLENVGTASAPAFLIIGFDPFGLASSTYGSNVYGSLFHGGPALVDIDGDADLDFFNQNAFAGFDFFENTGTSLAPAFTADVGPTGLSNGFGSPTEFADIDGDGDLDAFIGVGGAYPNAYIAFEENIGTAIAPNFDLAVADPFGLAAPDSHPSPVFADLDGDGDLDVMYGKYFGNIEVQMNTGTPLAPAFSAPSLNPFGFTPIAGHYTSKPALVDIDDDSDLDLFVGTRSTNATRGLQFYENLEVNCGDGILDPSEVCDGAALGGATCVTEGYDSGVLACAADCLSFNPTACVGQPCPPTPSGGCLAPGKAQFQLKANADPAKSSLKFKWQKGGAFAHMDLDNPVATTDTALCIYDETLGTPALVKRMSVPANAFWVDKDPKGFQLVDKPGTYAGVTKVQLKPNVAGKSSVSLQAKGVNLSLPTPISLTEYFDQDTDVTVQLVSEAGICWSADFVVAGTSKNDGVQFKSKTP